jgi:hypothetical protein
VREGRTDVDVSVDDFVAVCFGDGDAVYGCGCVGHGGSLSCSDGAQRNGFDV